MPSDSTETATSPEPKMPSSLVVDASAAIAWIRGEPGWPRVASTLEEHLRIGGEVLVPGHFWLEVANTLVRRYHFDLGQVVQEVQDLDHLGVRTVEVDRPLWLLAVDRMGLFGLTAYDAVYLAVAEANGAMLLTLDSEVARAAGSSAILSGPRHLQERPAQYNVREPDAVWAEFGDYLAKLRQDVLAG
jgi:predicted nucleic acid-binding protein